MNVSIFIWGWAAFSGTPADVGRVRRGLLPPRACPKIGAATTEGRNDANTPPKTYFRLRVSVGAYLFFRI